MAKKVFSPLIWRSLFFSILAFIAVCASIGCGIFLRLLYCRFYREGTRGSNSAVSALDKALVVPCLCTFRCVAWDDTECRVHRTGAMFPAKINRLECRAGNEQAGIWTALFSTESAITLRVEGFPISRLKRSLDRMLICTNGLDFLIKRSAQFYFLYKKKWGNRPAHSVLGIWTNHEKPPKERSYSRFSAALKTVLWDGNSMHACENHQCRATDIPLNDTTNFENKNKFCPRTIWNLNKGKKCVKRFKIWLELRKVILSFDTFQSWSHWSRGGDVFISTMMGFCMHGKPSARTLLKPGLVSCLNYNTDA